MLHFFFCLQYSHLCHYQSFYCRKTWLF
uniref:Uncharacterized protein n=1 Tax=Arundo donax TaxID=35708 RepID=A0A0A9MLU8_ARUDO